MTEREAARKRDLESFQEKLGHCFSDLSLLDTALTHSSYAHELGLPAWNERLEFLGDAVLEMLTSEELFAELPAADEGKLTAERASRVREEVLSAWGHQLGLDPLLRAGKGQRGRKSENMIGDAVEAVIGALYLDGGLDIVRHFLKSRPLDAAQVERDAKSRLQVFCQERSRKAPQYTMLNREGPDHQPIFTVEVSLLGSVLASGKGSSRKAAEQDAAAKALALLEKE